MSSKEPSAADAVQKKAEQMLAAEKRKAQTRNMIVAAISVLAVAAVVIGAVVLLQKNKSEPIATGEGGRPQTITKDGERVQTVTEDGGIIVGKESAPIKAKVYADFHCPHCATFEKKANPTLTKYVESGDLQVMYYPMAIMDRNSRNSRFSTRSASAAYCVANADVTKYNAFAEKLFSVAPKPGEKGQRNSELAAIAKEVGVTADIESCIKGKTFENFATESTKKAGQSGVNATPYLTLNGEKFDNWPQPGALEKKLEELKTKK